MDHEFIEHPDFNAPEVVDYENGDNWDDIPDCFLEPQTKEETDNV